MKTTITTEKRQKHKVGVAGSFINQMMANNCSVPEVGKGATRLSYSDRHCYEVIEVSKDGKTAKLEALDAQFAGAPGTGDIGHQNWKLVPTGRYSTIVWRHNAWRFKVTRLVLTEQFVQNYNDAIGTEKYPAIKAERDALFATGDLIFSEGKSEYKTEYNKVNILFGVKDYYYDWSF